MFYTFFSIDKRDVIGVIGVISRFLEVRMMNDGLRPLRSLEEWEADEPEPPITAGSSLEFLQAIYRSTDQPLARRMRAAIAALPFESPKLAVTANLGPDSGFAARLEAAIERSGGRLIEGEVVEGQGPG
jgi:hypothetical protein